MEEGTTEAAAGKGEDDLLLLLPLNVPKLFPFIKKKKKIQKFSNTHKRE